MTKRTTLFSNNSILENKCSLWFWVFWGLEIHKFGFGMVVAPHIDGVSCRFHKKPDTHRHKEPAKSQTHTKNQTQHNHTQKTIREPDTHTQKQPLINYILLLQTHVQNKKHILLPHFEKSSNYIEHLCLNNEKSIWDWPLQGPSPSALV